MCGKQYSQRKSNYSRFHVYNLKISYDNGDTVDTLIRKLSK